MHSTIILAILFFSGVLAHPAIENEIEEIENDVDDAWIDPVMRLFQ